MCGCAIFVCIVYGVYYLLSYDSCVIIFSGCRVRYNNSQFICSWYEESGKYFTKMNTFHDFADCGKHLVNSGITATDKLAIVGRSAGILVQINWLTPHFVIQEVYS